MRYTGTNPNGINQVASGSVGVFVENTRVATFGTNTLQVTGSSLLSGSLNTIGTSLVTGSLNASGSISFIGPQLLEGNLTVITGSIRINSGTLGSVYGSPVNGGTIYLGNDNATNISRDFSSPFNILRFKLLGLSSGGGWRARYIWSLNDGFTEPGYDVMTLTGNSNPNAATAVLVLSGSMTINGGGLSAGGTITGTSLASSTNTILSNALFSLTSSIGSPFENAVFKIGTNGSGGWASRYFFKNNWQGTELDTLTLVGNNGVVTVGINNTSPSFTLDVSGSSRITNNLTLSGSLIVTGSESLIGSKTINGNLTVTGSSVLSGSVSSIGSISINGNTTITGSTILSSSLSVIGTSNITGFEIVSGSLIVTGSLNVRGTVNYTNFGITYTTLQVSGSTLAATISTSSLFSASIATSQSVMFNAMVMGYGTSSRDTVTGEIKTTIKRVGGNATLVGTPFRYINADIVGSDINVGVSASVFFLSVTGSTTEPYNWFATITTQTV